MLVSRKNLLGEIANWGIQQCTTKLPFELEKTLLLVNEALKDKFSESKYGFGFVDFEYDELKDFLKKVLMPIPEFYKWNLTKMEYDKGIDVDSPTRAPFTFTSRYDNSPEECDHDFIDLGALIGNVCNAVKWDYERNKAFDEKFEKEHAQ